jgi:hypothetical protein
VIATVAEPIRAAATAASQPAWPAPITATSQRHRPCVPFRVTSVALRLYLPMQKVEKMRSYSSSVPYSPPISPR